MGTQPLRKKGQSRQFSAHVYCGQTAAWIKMPLGAEVGLGLRDIVLDVTQLPLPKGAQPSNFRPMSVVAKTAVWTKMPLSMEVGLGPRDFVFDENPAAPRKRAQPHPIFGPCLLWPNGWMDEDTTWHAVNLGPGTLF